MKIKLIPSIALGILLSLSSFAGNIDISVNDKVKNAFSEKFADAKEVNWHTTSSYIKASFKLNDQTMFAYYSADGALLGQSRNLLTSSLPMRLQAGLKKSLGNAWVAELFEYSNEEENSYYATIENADQKVYLKSSLNSTWSVVKKEKKN